MDPALSVSVLLFQAAKDGDVIALIRLLDDDPLILERVAATTADSPLHVASSLGNLDFARELLKHKDNVGEYVKQLNQHGYSPIHLAAANGHVHTVELLLQVSRELCCLKGRNGFTSLHCASMNGRSEIVSLFLSTSPQCVLDVTAESETALHIAVKNTQMECLGVLVEGLKQSNNLAILNWKDKEGNTLLHLAAIKKNYQAVELLVKCNDGIPGVLEVNATNERGLTAMDLFILCPSESGSHAETIRLLACIGAARSRDLDNIIIPANPNTHDQFSSHRPNLLTPTNSVTPSSFPGQDTVLGEEIDSREVPSRFQMGLSDPKDMQNGLLVVAVFILTATFQAVLNPPGGLRQQDPTNDQMGLSPPGVAGQEGFENGVAVLASNHNSFVLFMIANSIGFFMALTMIYLLISNFPSTLKLGLLAALAALTATYDSAMITPAPQGRIRNSFIVIFVLMPTAIILLIQIKAWIKRRKQQSNARRHHASVCSSDGAIQSLQFQKRESREQILATGPDHIHFGI